MKHADESTVYKRGDNDSFLDKGMAYRIGISVYGYQMIGDVFFGGNSFESFLIYQRENRSNRNEELRVLNDVFKKCYSGSNLADRFARLIFRSRLLAALYVMLHFAYRFAKGFVKRWVYG